MNRGGERLAQVVLVVFLSALFGCAIRPPVPVSLPLSPAPIATNERIPISIWTSWPRLLAAAEAEIPKCTASPDACVASDAEGTLLIYSEEDWEPVGRSFLGQQLGVKGSIWRSAPIQVAITGSHFEITLRLLYRARFGFVGGRELASCGVNDAAREATVRLSGDFRLAPGWYVDPTITVEVIPENLCRATMLNFDLSQTLADTMREQLQDEADDIEERIRQLTNVRSQVAPIWAWLNQPVALGRGLWFEIGPAGASASLPRISADERYLTLPIALKASPRVILGARPPTRENPLPPLGSGDVSPDFDLNINGTVEWAEASALLTEVLGEQGFSAGSRGFQKFKVAKATVSGSGKQVIIALQVRGMLNGTLYLTGTPRFEPRKDSRVGGWLVLDDVAYTIETRGFLTRLGVTLFSNQIHQAIKSNARWDLTSELQTGLAELTKALNRDLSPQVSLSGRITRFGPGEVHIGADGIEAWYHVGGTVEVEVRPF